MELIVGIPLLVVFMGAVMGVPYAYYLKRDLEYAREQRAHGAA